MKEKTTRILSYLTTDPEEAQWVKEELERRIKLNTEILKKHNII